MAKKNKKHKTIGKLEFIFNFLSLVTIICIGVYFGYRSLYYYSKQNNTINEEETLLAEKLLVNNQITKENIGFHQDKEGYYFKGKVENNYVKFANRTFRIVRLNNDNTIKLVDEDVSSIFMWGEESTYEKSNLRIWLTKTNNEISGIYYDTIPTTDKFLTKTSYRDDTLTNSKISKSKEKFNDFVTTLTIDDYIASSGKNSYLNTGKYFWLLGHNKDNMNLYVDEDGSVEETNSYESFGVRAVITLKKSTKITSGDGTINNPYIIKQEQNTNYIGQYVKLGDEIWKVYQDKNGVLKLSLTDALKINGVAYASKYSDATSEFDIADKKSLAYFLNTTYYNNLPYASYLLDLTSQVGEISNETGLNYANIYQNQVSSKVGLLNIFDYNPLCNLNNYYYLNTTSTVGSMAYVHNQLGILEEAKVTEERYIVPTIAIEKQILKNGEGTKEKPYTLE